MFRLPGIRARPATSVKDRQPSITIHNNLMYSHCCEHIKICICRAAAAARRITQSPSIFIGRNAPNNGQPGGGHQDSKHKRAPCSIICEMPSNVAAQLAIFFAGSLTSPSVVVRRAQRPHTFHVHACVCTRRILINLCFVCSMRDARETLVRSSGDAFTMQPFKRSSNVCSIVYMYEYVQSKISGSLGLAHAIRRSGKRILTNARFSFTFKFLELNENCRFDLHSLTAQIANIHLCAFVCVCRILLVHPFHTLRKWFF